VEGLCENGNETLCCMKGGGTARSILRIEVQEMTFHGDNLHALEHKTLKFGLSHRPAGYSPASHPGVLRSTSEQFVRDL
jgi:hypothetical protein